MNAAYDEANWTHPVAISVPDGATYHLTLQVAEKLRDELGHAIRRGRIDNREFRQPAREA